MALYLLYAGYRYFSPYYGTINSMVHNAPDVSVSDVVVLGGHYRLRNCPFVWDAAVRARNSSLGDRAAAPGDDEYDSNDLSPG
ncbi:hypothetical protein D3C76_1470670 [compost metagenome]